VRHMSRSSGLLRAEVSRVRVSQFASKLVEARWRVVHLSLLQRSRDDQVNDGWIDVMDCVRLCYHYFIVFIVLGSSGILIF
jgi:hypothetical protein